jgi:hypothetical protein
MHVFVRSRRADATGGDPIDVPQFDPGNAYHCGGQLRSETTAICTSRWATTRTARRRRSWPTCRVDPAYNVHVDPRRRVRRAALRDSTSNPFAGNTNGTRPEIYAYGFRNPWRFNIDPYTNELVCATSGEERTKSSTSCMRAQLAAGR